MRRLAVVVLAVALAGCKPPKYDQAIDCPTFHAEGVAVYIWNSGLFVVRHPDDTTELVSEVGCVIRR